MPIVQSIAGQILDDVYLIEVPTPPAIQGIPVGTIGLVGAFQQGISTGIYTISDYATTVRMLGKSTPDFKGALAIQNLIRQGAGDIRVVPAFGSTATAASCTINDGQTPAGELGTLTAAAPHPQTGIMTELVGPGPNAWVVSVSAGATAGTFNLTIQNPAGNEVYIGLTPTNWASIINGKSNIVIITTPQTPSTNVAAAGDFSFTGGTVGTVDDTAYIGSVNANGSRTGLALLETINPNLVLAAETGSAAINSAIATFANNKNCIGIVCAPKDSTVAAIKTAKSTITQDNVVFCDGWATYFDQDQGINVVCAPTAPIAGMAAQLAPQKSWGNKRIYGIQGLLYPRSKPELAELQMAGILALDGSIPRGGFGTRSGISSDGSTDIYIRRMRYFLEISVMNSMGWAVDELQSTNPKDKLRGDIKRSIETFLYGLAYPSEPALKIIDSYLIVCDLSNNPLDQIAAGKLSVTVKVRLLAAAKQIVISAEISTGTITTSSSAA